ncbi:hypothetical protein PIB30_052141 [Stylosanthes scabra]|uniref:Secreted protein n=1 Tax=Stylosanthes scabra TaxID=79078 RepID=A0ABU6XJH3_9FABA|nr:hypothetical protein [Stylosanthes scabra]
MSLSFFVVFILVFIAVAFRFWPPSSSTQSHLGNRVPLSSDSSRCFGQSDCCSLENDVALAKVIWIL